MSRKILAKIAQTSQNYQQKLDVLYRKRNGVYYTGIKLCNSLIKEMMPRILHEAKFQFFEPCVGVGNYVFAYLYQLFKHREFSKSEKRQILDGVYVADVNAESLKIFKSLFVEFCADIYGIRLDITKWEKTHVHTDGCIFNPAVSLDYMEPPFDGKRFDIVATNPPYLMLKMDSTKLDSKTYAEFKSLNNAISQIASKNFIYQSGIPNLYKLFIEEILRRYTTANALVSLLVPNSLLSDKFSADLRKFLLSKTKIQSIKVLPEHTKQIQASQGMCAIFCQKCGASASKNREIAITYDYLSDTQEEKLYSSRLNSVGVASSTNAIVGFSEKQIKKLEKLANYPKIKDFSFIRVNRGEFDLWQNKQYIMPRSEKRRLLVRGKHVDAFELKVDEITDSVSAQYSPSASKSADVCSVRIACQEISNQCIKKRVKWCPIPQGFIIANTCNYIVLSSNRYGITYNTLLGLLNSTVINWFFKLFSSRNHVSIFEINEFPIPLHKTDELKELTSLVDSYYTTQKLKRKEKLLREINSLSTSIYLGRNSG